MYARFCWLYFFCILYRYRYAVYTDYNFSRQRATTTNTTTTAGACRFIFSCKEKHLLIPAADGFFSLDATPGLLATARRFAPALFRSALSLLCVLCNCWGRVACGV